LTLPLLGDEVKKETRAVEGIVTISDHQYRLNYAVAYETRNQGEDGITLLVSDHKLNFEAIQAFLKTHDGSDQELSLDQMYLRLTFDRSGKCRSCSASNQRGAAFSKFGRDVHSELKLENGRVVGLAKLELQPDAVVKAAFEIRVDLPIGGPAPVKPAAGPVKPVVSGKFLGNGQPAKLSFVSVHPGEPFSDQPVAVIVCTEKDHARDPKPAFKAGFGEYGSALILSVHPDGKVIGCEVAHAGHGKMPFSSAGSVRVYDFEFGDGRMAGEISSDGEQKFFEKTWEVSLKFEAPYTPPGKPAAKTVTPAAPAQGVGKTGKLAPAAKPKTETTSDTKPVDTLKVKDLALPKDAKDIEYKQLVKFIEFKSATAVQPLAADFSKKLAAQGWKADKGGDLVTPKSAILSRVRGAAKLTIFVKPHEQGSRVTMHTEGLDWTESE